jgi:hypothetical protein
MAEQIREVNVEKGWRPAEGGPGTNTWGDYVALLHSEVSEMLEAYRDWKLEDRTERLAVAHREVGLEDQPVKPLGVGSEMADVLIRLLDMSGVFGFPVFDMDMELGDVASVYEPARGLVSFGDFVTMLHKMVTQLGEARDRSLSAAWVLRGLVTMARRYGIDLDAEYARKLAYNRTRAFRHGGRAL